MKCARRPTHSLSLTTRVPSAAIFEDDRSAPHTATQERATSLSALQAALSAPNWLSCDTPAVCSRRRQRFSEALFTGTYRSQCLLGAAPQNGRIPRRDRCVPAAPRVGVCCSSRWCSRSFTAPQTAGEARDAPGWRRRAPRGKRLSYNIHLRPSEHSHSHRLSRATKVPPASTGVPRRGRRSGTTCRSRGAAFASL